MFLTSLIYKDSTCISTLPQGSLQFQIFSSFTTFFLASFSWPNMSSHNSCCVIFLNEVIVLNLLNLGTLALVPYCCWFNATRHWIYDAQGPTYLQKHINIYWHHLLSAHGSYLYYIKWITFWYKIIHYKDPKRFYC